MRDNRYNLTAKTHTKNLLGAELESLDVSSDLIRFPNHLSKNRISSLMKVRPFQKLDLYVMEVVD